jgi:hypothetical protein
MVTGLQERRCCSAAADGNCPARKGQSRLSQVADGNCLAREDSCCALAACKRGSKPIESNRRWELACKRGSKPIESSCRWELADYGERCRIPRPQHPAKTPLGLALQHRLPVVSWSMARTPRVGWPLTVAGTERRGVFRGGVAWSVARLQPGMLIACAIVGCRSTVRVARRLRRGWLRRCCVAVAWMIEKRIE